ncbi:unnamed protein product [Chondrus crispus]|uniref:Uncharacterized protein n=1 Tax=Chondrus crispus TaxID=2769 RepID=S0F369_CHOCR|nr:unnamed protein product [Chondrus crispus]CDF77457.1 unnamed protein product [Chondrus crispus]|eukprot:XP_005712331.1 unnamed protein product [Chondrus crispus]
MLHSPTNSRHPRHTHYADTLTIQSSHLRRHLQNPPHPHARPGRKGCRRLSHQPLLPGPGQLDQRKRARQGPAHPHRSPRSLPTHV